MKRHPKGFSYEINAFLRRFLRKLLKIVLDTIYIRLRWNKNFYCKCIFDGMDFFILCDGTIRCVCGEMSNEKSLGNVYNNSVTEIWNGPEFEKLRSAFRNNKLPLDNCSWCIGPTLLPKKAPYPKTADFFKVVHLETTVKCNLDCSFCHREIIEANRGDKVLPPEKVYPILDEIIRHRSTECLLFVGYGEPFLDKNIFNYSRYLKDRFPEIVIASNTNAIPFSNKDNAYKLVESGLDTLILSIDGADEATYNKYRIGGDYHKAFAGMSNIIQARKELGKTSPTVIWQYILFYWNDDDLRMREAVEQAGEMGVDFLHFLPTVSPVGYISPKYILFKPYWGLMYKFCGPEKEYNPHNKAKVIEMKKS
jgi:MoaA/NifB/PqqE/SkfB family radical SAM enzyme